MQSLRVRSRWTETGEQLPDECSSCAPEKFEKFTAPSDKKIWMGWEAHPNEYVKSYPEDGGVRYDRKPEYRAEQENQLALPASDEAEAQQRAEERKRTERRIEPMTPDELLAALAKARWIAEALQKSAAQTAAETQEAEVLSWGN